ncbi:hypothetical protein, partial [Gordonibacter pamelaeae]|uniref:hypothetical protein n=1 Tax=Gordonibacter pamelaeae TaxID=471189 RepID=UPI001D062B96
HAFRLAIHVHSFSLIRSPMSAVVAGRMVMIDPGQHFFVRLPLMGSGWWKSRILAAFNILPIWRG